MTLLETLEIMVGIPTGDGKVGRILIFAPRVSSFSFVLVVTLSLAYLSSLTNCPLFIRRERVLRSRGKRNQDRCVQRGIAGYFPSVLHDMWA